MAGDIYYNNVSLLLHCDGTNGSTTFTDNSPNPKTVTPAGNAQVSTAQSKFGGASASFDGTGDYLSIPTSGDFTFGTGDFTIEFYIRLNNVTTSQSIINQWRDGNRSWVLYYGSSYGLEFTYSTNGSNYTAVTRAGALSNNTWHHIAVCRDSSNLRLFIDGIQAGATYNIATTALYTSTSDVWIGQGYPAYLPVSGYIDDIRITKGIARYTANFTPPTEAFPNALQREIAGNVPLTATVAATFNRNRKRNIVGVTTVTTTVNGTPHLQMQYTIAGGISLAVNPSSPAHRRTTYFVTETVAITTVVAATLKKYASHALVGAVPIATSVNAVMLQLHRSQIIGSVSLTTTVASPIEFRPLPWITEGVFPLPTLSATMHSEYLNIAGGFLDTTLHTATGWNAAGGFLATELSSTGTLTETMTVNAAFIETTLSASVNVDERIATSLGFISSTLVALGGWNAKGGFPAFTLASNVTVDSNRINVAGSFLSTSLAFSATIEERISIAGGFIDTYLAYGSITGGFLATSLSATMSSAIAMSVAYVLNVHTTESTKYSNYPFLHIVHIGGKPYGVKADGLYLLEGATDAGTAISGSMTTKETDFGSFNSKHINDIYLNSDTDTTMTPTVDGVLIAAAYPSSFGGHKIQVARGLEGRYWKFRFDGIQKLEGLEISPLIRQRKVK